MLGKLIRTELTRTLRGSGATMLAIAVVAVGIHFALVGGRDIHSFLWFTYIALPTSLVVVTATRIPWERQSGLLDMILTTGHTRASYYWATAAGLLATGLAYLVLTAPFSLMVVAFAGAKWASVLSLHMGLALLVILGSLSIGLLVGTLFPGRFVASSIFAGCLIALVSLAWPVISAALVASAEDPAAPALRSLILSGAFVAESLSPTLSRVHVPSTPRFVAAALAAWGLSLGIGHYIFTRLQNAQTWVIKPRQAHGLAMALATLAAVTAFAAPAATLVGSTVWGYGSPPEDAESRLSYGVYVDPRHAGGISVGSEYPELLLLSVRHPTGNIVIEDVRITFQGEDFQFAPATVSLGSIRVDADGETVIPLTSTVRVVGSSAPFQGTARYSYAIDAAGQHLEGSSIIPVRSPSSGVAFIPVAVAGILAGLVLVLRRTVKARW